MRNECVICLDEITIFFRKKLRCGHAFHKKCINKALEKNRTCPICSLVIFDDYETKLLNNRIDSSTIRLNTDRAIEILRESIKRRNSHRLVQSLINKYDPARLVYEYIANKDAKSLKTIIDSRFLNWHSTLNGKSIIETALDSEDEIIINIVVDADTKR